VRTPVAPGPVKPLPDPEQESIPRPAIEKSTPAEIEALGLKKYGPHDHKGKYDTPHYKLGWVTMSWGDKPLTEEEKQQRFANAGVVHIEMWGKRLITYSVKDLWSEADEKAWKKETAEKYMILADVGRTKWAKGYSADRRPWYVGAERPDEQVIDICVMYATKDGSYAKAWVYAVEEPSVTFRHEFDNLVIRGGRSDATRKAEGGYVYEVQDHAGNREGAVWLSGDRVVVKVVGDEYPAELIEGYLKKYPSALDKVSRIDFGRWAAEEFALRLRRIDEAADRLAAGKKQRISVYDELTAVRTRFAISLEGYSESKDFDSPEKLRALRKQLADWWEANKDKLRWNHKARKFEVGE
jgi:hypothetical protein